MLFLSNLNAKNEEIKQYIPISQSLAFDKMSPSIYVAERDYLRPLIGDATLTALQTYYDSTPLANPTADQKKFAELLKRCQRAVINLAFLLGFDALNSEIDDSGFGRTESESRKGLYKYQEDNLRDSFRINGFNSFDDVLTYLHENISTFTTYAASTEYAGYKTSFYKSAAEFDGVLYISKSNLTFLRLKRFIGIVEDFDIKKVLGDTYMAYIKTEMAKTTPDAKVTAILPYIKKPMAFLAAAKLMEETGAELSENGLYFTSWAISNNNQLVKQPSNPARVESLITSYTTTGNDYIAELKRYLAAHLTDWPLFETTKSYMHQRDNTNKKTFWA